MPANVEISMKNPVTVAITGFSNGEGGESRTHVRKHIHKAFSERSRLLSYSGRPPAGGNRMSLPISWYRTYTEKFKQVSCIVDAGIPDCRWSGPTRGQLIKLQMRICFLFYRFFLTDSV